VRLESCEYEVIEGLVLAEDLVDCVDRGGRPDSALGLYELLHGELGLQGGLQALRQRDHRNALPALREPGSQQRQLGRSSNSASGG